MQHHMSLYSFCVSSVSRGLLYETDNMVIHRTFLLFQFVFPLDHFVGCLYDFLVDKNLFDCVCSAVKQLPIDLLLTVCVNKI